MIGNKAKSLPAFSLSNGQRLEIIQRKNGRDYRVINPEAPQRLYAGDLKFSDQEIAAVNAGSLTFKQLAEIHSSTQCAVATALRRLRTRP